MGFWHKVKEEIDFTGITRKTMSFETGIPVQTINRAIERDSRPYLEEALKIAKFFNKPVEYFLEEAITLTSEKNLTEQEKTDEIKNQLNLYRKYHDLIQNCEFINESKQNAVKQLAQNLAQEEPSYTSSKK